MNRELVLPFRKPSSVPRAKCPGCGMAVMVRAGKIVRHNDPERRREWRAGRPRECPGSGAEATA